MDLRSIYIVNCVAIFLLLILFFVSRAKILRRRPEDKLYTVILFGVMLGAAMEILSYVIEGKLFPGARVLSYAINTYIFSANMLLPLLVLFYADLSLYGNTARIKKIYKPQIIVAAAMLAVNVVNFFFPLSFYISPQNEYSRGPLFYLYYAVIVYFCASIFIALKRYEKENGARAFLDFVVFLLPIVTGAGVQFVVYGISLAWLSSAIGLVALFMMQQNEIAYIDPLVDTYNRHYMDRIISSWISQNREFAGVMLDIDSFKSINDMIGHSEGDKTLKALTEILKSCGGDGEWVFRFAGDEFIVLKQTGAPEELYAYMDEVTKKIDAFNEEGRPYKLSVSYGVMPFCSDGVDVFMKELDAKMYEMKDEHHREASV
ncbi:MAG: diguanylate cyclase [Clostridia bacterium]|nr:diguanylate cyclase [Clostridia bacterium]